MLNFDPHRWLEQQGGRPVATVATVAGVRVESENTAVASNPALTEGVVESSGLDCLPATPATAATNPPALLRDWHRHLSAVDQFVSPTDWTLDAWLKLTDTALWLYESHASYAVRNGWSVHDLFGVRAGMPRCGGLADQLDGARDLKLSGGRAYWSRMGVQFRMNVGCGDGCVLLWELG